MGTDITYKDADNKELVSLLADLFKRIPSSITHGEFNRRIFLETFVFEAGTNCSVSEDDIRDNAYMTKKEFKDILHDYMTKGIVVEKGRIFGRVMYGLNTTFKQGVEDKAQQVKKQNEQDATDTKDRRTPRDRRVGERRKQYNLPEGNQNEKHIRTSS